MTKLVGDWDGATRGVGCDWTGAGAIGDVGVVVELAGLWVKRDLGLGSGDDGSGKVSSHAPGSEESHDLGDGFFGGAPAVEGEGCAVGKDSGDEAEADPSSDWLAAGDDEVVAEVEADGGQ